jgi:hypothetical protein
MARGHELQDKRVPARRPRSFRQLDLMLSATRPRNHELAELGGTLAEISLPIQVDDDELNHTQSSKIAAAE